MHAEGPVLVVNAGSSSLKFAVYRPEKGTDSMRLLLRGQVDGLGTAHSRLQASDGTGTTLEDRSLEGQEALDHAAATSLMDASLAPRLGAEKLVAAGHRVVHGGPQFREPVRVDDAILAELEALVPLAPLHQPHNLAVIRAIGRHRPELPQVACFDTAFHRGHAKTVELFALPLGFYEKGVRRYGFHGLSYEYIARALPAAAPEIADGRVVVAHLGNGASLCALKARKSVDSTMAFTALEGLPMGTRPGSVDPGVLLYLMQSKGYDATRLERLLYHEAGLLGLSGVSSDMRDLLASGAPDARDAIDHFVFRIVKETGALASVLGGLDGFVFTAGIGEHAVAVREKVCEGLSWLGLTLDAEANAHGGPRISSPGSRVAAYVIPTDEERMIAQHTLETLHLQDP
jgi:acetate kinase